MIVAIEMNGGEAFFTQKWVRTERLAHDKKQGHSVYEFGSMAVGKMGRRFSKQCYEQF